MAPAAVLVLWIMNFVLQSAIWIELRRLLLFCNEIYTQLIIQAYYFKSSSDLKWCSVVKVLLADILSPNGDWCLQGDVIQHKVPEIIVGSILDQVLTKY